MERDCAQLMRIDSSQEWGSCMRPVVTLCIAVLLLTGCTVQGRTNQGPSIDPQTAASIAASSGVDVPADAASIPRADARGRTPDQAVLALIETANDGEWDTLYSMYATPTPDLDTAIREWVEARETYEGFRVLETRVVAPDAAFVRVTYRVTTQPMGQSAYSGETEEAGEWWPLHKLDGQWKVQWMPRQ